ncbi:MAG: 1-acyl-sn-glycerol-3-phosphate acyltransferase [Anaerolineae bacterium]
MASEHVTVGELREAISEEILVAAGVPRTGLLQALLRPLFWFPAHRAATVAAEFDRRVALNGLPEAMGWLLSMWVDDTRAYGLEHVPKSGPLVIASNHPGSYDLLAIGSCLGRDDLKIAASDVPILRHLRATAPHLIYTYLGDDSSKRITAARESIRHLRTGGSLLVFAAGEVEPDPALLPGAAESLQKWSSSPAWLLRQVPDAVLVVTIASHVLAPSSLRSPLTRLRKERKRKQFLAETTQIGQQVLFGRRFGLVPEVRFGRPLTAADLGGGRDLEAARTVIVAQAERLLPSSQAELAKLAGE